MFKGEKLHTSKLCGVHVSLLPLEAYWKSCIPLTRHRMLMSLFSWRILP